VRTVVLPDSTAVVIAAVRGRRGYPKAITTKQGETKYFIRVGANNQPLAQSDARLRRRELDGGRRTKAVAAALVVGLVTLGVYLTSRLGTQDAALDAAKRGHHDEIARLSHESAEAAKQSAALASGGESIVYVAARSFKGIVNLVVYQEGKYPMYDVQLSIQDDDSFNKQVAFMDAGIRAPLAQALAVGRQSVSLGNINPGSASFLSTPTWESASSPNHRRFKINITARNGFFYEDVSWRRLENGKNVSAMRLYRLADDMVLLKQEVSEFFPKDDKGEPQW